MLSYLEELTLRLASGAAELPEATRQRHAAWLLAQQREDGGFAGREGGSDLYYTSFALRGLAILGELHGERAERSAAFLRSCLSGKATVVDFLAFVYSARMLDASAGIDIFSHLEVDWRSAIAAKLETLRRDDGGYAKTEEGAAGSTYHSFLVLCCLQLIEREAPDPEKLIDFLYAQQSEEGGFREIRAAKRGGVNPTAAAIGALRILGALAEDVRMDTIDFLAEMQSEEGGLKANSRIPLPDLLSTFTGLLTLIDLGGLERLDTAAARRFVHSLEIEEGGFHGFAFDPASDVEYTFYGVGALALLAAPGQ